MSNVDSRNRDFFKDPLSRELREHGFGTSDQICDYGKLSHVEDVLAWMFYDVENCEVEYSRHRRAVLRSHQIPTAVTDTVKVEVECNSPHMEFEFTLPLFLVVTLMDRCRQYDPWCAYF